MAQYLWLRLLAQGTPATSAASATTTSRSMAGAAPRSATSCASRRTSPAPRSSGWSATTARRRTSWPPPRGLIAHNEGRLGKTLWTEDRRRARRSRCAACGTATRRRASSARRSRRCSATGTRSAQIAILVRAGFQTREFEERFITLGLPYRVIGGPRFYERQEIRDALAYLRVTVQPDDDLAFERIVNTPRRGLGESALQHAARVVAARRRRLAVRGGAPRARDRRAEARRQRKSLGDLIAELRPLARRCSTACRHIEVAETRARRSRLHRDAAAPTDRPRRRAGWRT